jgi:hypothetical protein
MGLNEEILELKEAYRIWQSLDVSYEYGLIRGYSTSNHAIIHRLWGRTDLICEKILETQKIEDGIFKIVAPSPWHAYFILRIIHHIIYRGLREFGLKLDDSDNKNGEHIFFRGQRCSNWEYISSLRRNDDSTKNIERRAVYALTEYFKTYFSKKDDFALNISRCFAQHYGIATELVDISCSPDIAVWFATHPIEPSCPNGDNYGVVRAFNWLGGENEAKTLILMPPPFVKNLYQQRALFIDTSNTGGIVKGNFTIEVKFPRMTCGGEFQVWRQNQIIDVWPKIEKPEQDLIEWSRKIAVNSTNTKNVRIMVEKDRRKKVLPDFWLKREIWNYEGYMKDWIRMLEWVLPYTCVTALPIKSGIENNQMRYEIHNYKVMALVLANIGLFRSMIAEVKESDVVDSPIFKNIIYLAQEVIKKRKSR